MAFATSSIGQFLVTGAGRLVRIALGVVIIGVGLGIVGGPAGAVLALVGVVPLAAGVFDVCVLSPLFGGPFSGRAIRDAGRRSAQIK